VFEAPPILIGVDEEGRLVRFVPDTNVVILACAENLLFFLPLLDTAPALWSHGAGGKGELQKKLNDLIDAVIIIALLERSPTYVGRALQWLEEMPSDRMPNSALHELERSHRGTQEQRHAARRLRSRP
jgi:hypothetical protein